MLNWPQIGTILVTFLVIIDPVGLIPIFMSLTYRQSIEQRRRTALVAILIAAGALAVFAIGGKAILPLLGITIPALQISGGILLLLLSIEMVFARQSGLRSTTPAESAEAQGREDVAVFPLAVPLIAGPGAITSAIILMQRSAPSLVMQLITLALMFAVLALTYVAFRLSSSLMNLLGVTGINVIGRVLGIVLAALAIQFVLDGMGVAFPNLVGGSS